jgi:RNA polymerase sigma-70 factor (sigma-E family)
VIAEPPGFREFVEARSGALLRTAWMLTGDAASAEDLLQTALARTWPRWNRLVEGHPEAYVRTVMVRLNARWGSRRWSGERPSGGARELSALGGAGLDEHARTDDRVMLLDALAALPVRQRQAVVLRYFDDLPVTSVAQIMGSSEGTVKSQTAKGLAKLRTALATDQLVPQEES